MGMLCGSGRDGANVLNYNRGAASIEFNSNVKEENKNNALDPFDENIYRHATHVLIILQFICRVFSLELSFCCQRINAFLIQLIYLKWESFKK